MKELLSLLKKKGCLLGIVTGGSLREVEEVLRVLKLDEFISFEHVVHADSIPFRKPSPEPVLEGVRRLRPHPPPPSPFQGEGEKGEEVVFVGDSEHDIRSGKLAGVRTIGVLGGSSTEERLRGAEPDMVVPSLEVLIEQLER